MKKEINIKKLLQEFVEIIVKPDLKKEKNDDDKIIYNEYSLQHELGKFLEINLPEGYLVQFEKPIICENKEEVMRKKECDIVIKKKGVQNNKIAIELKFPTIEVYVRKMFMFMEDIKFMEQVKNKRDDFVETYSFVVASKEFHDCNYKVNFRSNDAKVNEIKKKYCEIFRTSEINFSKEIEYKHPENIYGVDTSKRKQPITFDNNYKTQWIEIDDTYKYYILEI